MKNALIIVTEKGGHGAYLTAIDCRNQLSWAEKLALRYFSQMV
jgi:predicted alpha/beta-fold hydrolase